MSFPKLSKIEYVVLDLLRSGRAMYGLEMVHDSEGKLKRGTIYTTLNRMIDKGYLKSHVDKEPHVSGLPRRKYQISAEGQAVLHAVDAYQSFKNLGGAHAQY